ncbi:MAG: transcription elongation factor GreB [Bdellovibrionaceae bacterium]|nr:transcription elongation factor GreB [Pseudobdellovibrionaceae bacterium]
MSKAFVKDDDSADDAFEDGGDQDAADEGASVPRGSRNYMTPQGAEKLRAELHELLHVERPKVVETVAWAASNGDRSENADYIYGKRRLREIDRRVRFLSRRLDSAQVVDPAAQSSDRILFGATVTVRNENDEMRVYQIVGIDETDAKRGRVSWISPIGKSLLQAKVGDVVLLKTPKGEEELEIEKIEYKAIDGGAVGD